MPNRAACVCVRAYRTRMLLFLRMRQPLRKRQHTAERAVNAPLGNVETVMAYQTVRRLRPLARLAFSTCRPASSPYERGNHACAYALGC